MYAFLFFTCSKIIILSWENYFEYDINLCECWCSWMSRSNPAGEAALGTSSQRISDAEQRWRLISYILHKHLLSWISLKIKNQKKSILSRCLVFVVLWSALLTEIDVIEGRNSFIAFNKRFNLNKTNANWKGGNREKWRNWNKN